MIVITGGAGFIGSCAVARLNSFGWSDILVVDHLEPDDPKKANLHKKQYVRFVDKNEFLDEIKDGRWQNKIEAVVHLGACSDTTGTDADYYETNNFLYTKTIAEWCLKEKVRLIYASSAATYGDGAWGYRDDEDTTRKLKPLNLYGESKQKFDLWALDQKVLDRMVGLKFFNVFGPNEYHKGDMRSVVAKSYAKVVEEGKIRLFKSYHPDYRDGEQKRDFIYVKDVVEVIIWFLENPSINGLYNLGSGVAQTWNQLAEAVFAAVEKPVNIEYMEMPEHLKGKYQYFTQAEMSKLRAAGYKKPFTDLRAAVKDYARYLKTNSCY